MVDKNDKDFNTDGEPTTAQHREWGKKRSAHPGRKRCMMKDLLPYL